VNDVSDTMPFSGSEHLMTFITSVKKTFQRKPRVLVTRSFKKTNFNKLDQDFSSKDWEQTLEEKSCTSVMLDSFNFKAMEIIHQHSTIIKRKLKSRIVPWFNKQVVDSIKIRDQLHSQFLRF